MPRHSGINCYNEFVDELNTHFEDFSSIPAKDWMEDALKYVDGLAASELRRLVTLETRREFGAFFTPKELGKMVVDEMFPKLNENSVIYDPACGAGNLLLSTWDYLNENRINPKKSRFLLGTDIHREFVEAANIRLAIKQLILEPEKKKLKPSQSHRFMIDQLDGLTNNIYYEQATHIFVNPPYNMIAVTDDVKWSKGVASAAALFLDRIIKYVQAGTTITAILPEVLRSGSRYHTWRGMILRSCTNEKVKLLGQFDKHADVDVFAITLKKRNSVITLRNSNNKLQPVKKAKETIKDNFKICVGPVVDNRDEEKGRRRGYIVSRGLPGWSIQNKFKLTRNHQGKSFKGPFIVIKRTSRMGDSQRAIATIINTPCPVYVDNHLIILIPNSGEMADCEKMIANLRDLRTDDWLNKEIRCRHLTVKIVSKIPKWK